MKNTFDVVIIGGGHAGAEAAWISSQFNLRVALISSPESGLASAPCNPAIGGVGKGQVVREIDALGGLMGLLADRAGIQYRTLNESKGFAVQSTRVQIDKELYTKFADEILNNVSALTIFRDMVNSIDKVDGQFQIKTKKGEVVSSLKIIVTTGTFLNGKLHTGEEQKFGGRVECEKSVGLNELLKEIKTNPNRFKTGTPPRLDRKSIDFSKLEPQESDSGTRNFHSLNSPFTRESRQVCCYLTKTNSQTLSIIRANKERSPIFNGQIKGIGPRYCPSIEDKAFRYTEKDVHHVFIEPEGLELDTIYPNGVSTSLPKDVQESFVQTISGLENAKILIHGYAVEYDVVDTSQLSRTMEYFSIPGLYFAGQVCGTSGYEEAAGQGIIAGINASLAILEKEPLILDRNDSYIGVMIEDLVTNKRDEPYRLFTARSENRLYVREDNTVLRMRKYRRALGLSNELDHFQENFIEEVELLEKLVDSTMFYSTKESKEYFKENSYGPLEINISFKELLKRPDNNPITVLERETRRFGTQFRYDVLRTVAIATKYEGYIDRSIIETERVNRLGKKKIDWQSLAESKNISFECRLRISTIRPETFAQLQRIEGIRPATLAFVAGNIIS
ncbi:MAG: tRNA uridine-5-carboxymethylaminomethyl(34) synthesis enzyme MnmG [Bacteriovorax sp.]|jgi:tRNA uridine 5-carboxymethylaminomethyl modification enzyme|nr:tRNA uridine-5-carboxymethylaminomethyl(34) synthesis enzyme MnmG [Bacteriovorax sp.]